MNTFTAFFAASALAVSAGYVQAKDLGPDEALKLRDAGTIQSFEKLNAAALAKHRMRPSPTPSWNRNMANTFIKSNCVMPRASSGTSSSTQSAARYSKTTRTPDDRQ